MKKLLLLIMLILIISIANADSCQYPTKVVVGTEIKDLPYNLLGSPLQEIELTVNDAWWAPLTVRNSNPVPIQVFFVATVKVDESGGCFGIGTTTLGSWTNNITIPAKSSRNIDVFPLNNNNSNCKNYKYAEAKVINYYATDSVLVKPTRVNITEEQCILKNDNAPCIIDSECGSKICNIAGFCGKEKVVPCPKSTLNCNNQSCNIPSIKRDSEVYTCIWECKSNFGTNNICKENPTTSIIKTILLIVGICLGLAISLYLYVKITKEKGWNKQKENILKPAKIQAKEMEQKAKERIIEIVSLEQKIKKLKHKENKTKFDNTKITKMEQETSEKLNNLDHMYIQLLYSRFGKDNVEISGNGYPIFSDSKNEIHRIFYKEKYEEYYKKPFDTSRIVHHIDANRLNSITFENLIDLSYEQHKKIKHLRIPRGDWEYGLKVLMDALNWEEENLPKHILRHLEKNKKR